VIVDTSAVIAVLAGERDAQALLDALAGFPSKLSAANYLEAGIVVDARRDPVLSADLDDLLRRTDTEVVSVSARHATIARQAYRDFGKGSGHRAQLNFGDCFAYALAIDTGEPLLFKGGDFSHTGVRRAV
jgi:ribonuclease VapC